ncbi:MAG: hypothetical protein E6Q67_14240 [Roseateles sp.]|nr:MAG: hypothetical protein E6Q67_14240 [Roseateles sp.]
MADTIAPLGARTAAASSLDPIQLQAQAMNSLSRCQRELRADVPSYSAARSHLELAQQAMAALEAIDTGSQH